MFSHSGSQVKNMDILSNVGRILLSKELSGELPTRLKTDNPAPKDFEETPGDAVEILTDSTPEKKANKGTTTSCFRREQACEIVEKVLRNESLTFAVCFIGGPERANFNVYDPQQYLEGSLVPETLFCATDEYSTDFFDGIVGRVSPWIQGNKLKPGVEGNHVFFGQTKFIPRTIGRAAYIKLMQKCLSEELRFADAVGMKAVMMEGREYKSLETTNLVSVLNSAQFQDFYPQIWMVYPLILSQKLFLEAEEMVYSDEISLFEWGKLKAKMTNPWKLHVCLKISLEMTGDLDERVLERWLTEPIAAVWLEHDLFACSSQSGPRGWRMTEAVKESMSPALRKFLRVLFTRQPGCSLILDSKCAYPPIQKVLRTVRPTEPEPSHQIEQETSPQITIEPEETNSGYVSPGIIAQSIAGGSMLNVVSSDIENDLFEDAKAGDSEICGGIINKEINGQWLKELSRFSNLGFPSKLSHSRPPNFRDTEDIFQSASDLTMERDAKAFKRISTRFGTGGFLGTRSVPNSPAKPGFGAAETLLRRSVSKDLAWSCAVLTLSANKLQKERGISVEKIYEELQRANSKESVFTKHSLEWEHSAMTDGEKESVLMREKKEATRNLGRDSGFSSRGTSSRSNDVQSPEHEQTTTEPPAQDNRGTKAKSGILKVKVPNGKRLKAMGWPKLDVGKDEQCPEKTPEETPESVETKKSWITMETDYGMDAYLGYPNAFANALQKLVANTIVWGSQFTDFERSVALKTAPTIFRGFEGRRRPGNMPDLEALYSEYGAAFQLAVSQLYKTRSENDCWMKDEDELVVALIGVSCAGELVKELLDRANSLDIEISFVIVPIESSFISIFDKQSFSSCFTVASHVSVYVESGGDTWECVRNGSKTWNSTGNVDVVLWDLLGDCGQTEWVPEVLGSIQNWLKEDTVIIPERYTVMVAPVAAPKLTDLLSQSDHSKPFEWPQILLHGGGVLFPLAEAKPFMSYETPYALQNSLFPDGSDKTQTVSQTLTWKSNHDGILGGYVAYLELEMINNVRKITSLPGQKTDATYLRCFRPTFFPLDPRMEISLLKHNPKLVSKGSSMKVQFRLNKSFEKEPWSAGAFFKMWYEWETIVKDEEVWPRNGWIQNKGGLSHSVEFKKSV